MTTCPDSALPTVRMLHTSDLHVAGDERSMEGLRAVVDAALDRDVHIVLIAGDLFDSSRVGPDVVATALQELGRLDRPCVVIPGNHDCLDERSIYHRVDLTTAGGHVYFAGDPAGEEVVFDELSLVVWARGIESHDPSNRPLAGYPAAKACDSFSTDQSACWRVVMTHGHYVPRGELSDRSSPIKQEEIGALECHYVALGHWHRFTDVSEGGVTAFYSGSPSEPGANAGTVNLVTLDGASGGRDATSVRVERHTVRRLTPT